MAIKQELKGKQHPPFEYEVGREKVREYARAVAETNPLYLDPDAARVAGFANVVAPPMFCVVYSSPAMGPAILDPEVEQMSYWVAEIRNMLGTYLEVLLSEDDAFDLARRREAESS